MFFPFYGFIFDFLEFPSVKSFRILRFTNFRYNKVGFVQAVFSIFFQIYVFHRCDFPEKQAPTKVKYLLPVYQILRNFTKGNASTHRLYWSFRRQRIRTRRRKKFGSRRKF